MNDNQLEKLHGLLKDFSTAMLITMGIDATKKIPGEGFKRPWPPIIKMDVAVKAKIERLLGRS